MRFVAAGLLSLVVPGAGQAYLGRRRAALVFAIPFLALAGAALVLYATSGPIGLLVVAVTPGALPALAVLNIALAVWRLAAAVDAIRGAPRLDQALGVVGAAALLLVLAPHAWAGITIGETNDLIDSTFAPEGSPAAVAEPSLAPTHGPYPTDLGLDPVGHDPYLFPPSPAPTPSPTKPPAHGPRAPGTGTLPSLGVAVPWARPGAIPWGSDGRFDLLLLGSDGGAGRWSRRMDAMMLVEVNVATGKVTMIGVPRNLINSPFPPGSAAAKAVACGCFRDLLNAIYVEATVTHPARWPGTGAIKGIGAVRAMISTLTGRPIDAVVVADLWGMIKIINTLGGVDVNVPYAIRDSTYADPYYGHLDLRISAGHHHFDGRMALAYSRTRHQDSDYGRMSRQQIMVTAILHDISPATILNAPALVAQAKGFVWTDLPREALPNLAALFQKAASASVSHLRIVPPKYPEVVDKAEVARIRTDIAKLLGLPPPTSPSPSPSPSTSTSAGPTPSERTAVSSSGTSSEPPVPTAEAPP